MPYGVILKFQKDDSKIIFSTVNFSFFPDSRGSAGGGGGNISSLDNLSC
jgi:hypothetical protein